MINDAKNKIISTHGCIKIDATDRTGEEQCCIFLPDGSRALVWWRPEAQLWLREISVEKSVPNG